MTTVEAMAAGCVPVVIDKERYGLDRDELAAAFAKENLFVRKY